MYYKETIRPRYSELDRNAMLDYGAILAVLEYAAGHHSESAHDDMLTNHSRGVSWILAEWRVQIARRPSSTDTMHVRTWVRGRPNSALIYRDLVMTDDSGDELLRAEAKFVMMDLETGRLTRVGEERFLSYGVENEKLFDEELPKLLPLESYEHSVQIELRAGDFDINRHVHNTRFMDLVFEALARTCEGVAEAPDGIAAFRLSCKRPLPLGSGAVTAETCRTGTGYGVLIRSEGEVCALAELAARV